MMCATQLNPNKPNHYFTASPVRARERQIRAPKKHILGGLSRVPYSYCVTVYPYNGYINSTNPIVRHVTSLTCILKRLWAKQRAPKHAKTQPLHGSNMRARAPNLIKSQITGAHCRTVEAPCSSTVADLHNAYIVITNLIVQCCES